MLHCCYLASLHCIVAKVFQVHSPSLAELPLWIGPVIITSISVAVWADTISETGDTKLLAPNMPMYMSMHRFQVLPSSLLYAVRLLTPTEDCGSCGSAH